MMAPRDSQWPLRGPPSMRPDWKQVVFRNLSTSSKLALLCGTFVIALAVAIYGLVAEKAIAIEFARKEMVGTRYLDAVRGFYAAILAPSGRGSADGTLAALDAAEAASEGQLDTLEMKGEVSAALRRLRESQASGRPSDADYRAVFAAAQSLANRIGDDSNLTLDPDLDTYYLQDIAVKRLPTLLGYLGEARSLAGTPGRTQSDNADSMARLDVVEGLIYTALSGLSDELAAGSRHTGDLESQLGSKLADMNISIRSYLQTIRGADGEQPQAIALGDGNRAFHITVQNTLGVWAAT